MGGVAGEGALGDWAEGGRDARTLGEWLEDRLRAHQAAAGAQPSPLENRKVAEALERLAKRLEAQERRSALTAANLDRALDGLSERLGASEQAQTDAADRLLRSFLALERSQGGLHERLATLEAEASPEVLGRFEAHALALASGLDEVRSSSTRELAVVRDNLSRLAQAAQESLEELEGRLDGAPFASHEAVEVLQQDAATLRKALTQARSELGARLELLAGGAAAAQDLAALKHHHGVVSERQDAALARLSGRLEALTAKAAAREDLEESARQVSDALATLADRLGAVEARDVGAERRLEEMRAWVESSAARAEAAAEAARDAALDRCETVARVAEQRLEEVERRGALAVEVLRREQLELQERAAAASDSRLADEAARLRRDLEERAQTLAAESRVAIENARRELDVRMGAALAAVESGALAAGLNEALGRVRALESGQADLETRLIGELEARGEAARQELETRMQAAIARAETGPLAEGLTDALQRLDALEASRAEASAKLAMVEQNQGALARDVSVELKRWSEGLERRFRGIEGRLTGEGEALHRLASRFEKFEGQAVEAAGEAREALAQLSLRIEERAVTAERRAAQALEQVGAQIIELAERLEQRQRMLLQEAAGRLAAAEQHIALASAERTSALEHRVQELEARLAEPQQAPAPATEDVEPFAHEVAEAAEEAVEAPRVTGRLRRTQPRPPEVEEHYLEDVPEPRAPRYDFVDALDAILSKNGSASGQALAREELLNDLLEDSDDPLEVEAAEPVEDLDEPEVEAFAGNEDEEPQTLGEEPEAIEDAAEGVDQAGDYPEEDAFASDGDASDAAEEASEPVLQLAEHQRVGQAGRTPGASAGDRPPLDPSDFGDEMLFDRPAEPGAAPKVGAAPGPVVPRENEREPSYLAAARRAARQRSEEMAKPQKPKTSKALTRALLWAAAALAAGSSIYALSQSGDPQTGPRVDGEDFSDPLESQSASAAAARRVLETAAERISLERAFPPQAVELPGADGEAVVQEALLEPAEPLAGAQARPEGALPRAGPRG